MNKNILMIIIFSFIIYKIFYNDEKMMSLGNIPKIDTQPKIEITSLVKCRPILYAEYDTNYNHIINDGKKIYSDTIKPLDNRIIYDGHRYNLASIEFNKGTTTFNEKKVHLEMHLVHTSTINDYILRIVIPLSLTDVKSKVIENFDNNDDFYYLNKKKSKKILDKFDKNNFDKKNKFNKEYFNTIRLIEKKDIPFYQCCSPNVGKLKKMYLNRVNCIVNKSPSFYKYEPTKKSIWFYTLPKKFSKIVGKRILESLIK